LLKIFLNATPENLQGVREENAGSKFSETITNRSNLVTEAF